MNHGAVGRSHCDIISQKANQHWIFSKLGGISLIDGSLEEIFVHVHNARIIPNGKSWVSYAGQHIISIIPNKILYVRSFCYRKLDEIFWRLIFVNSFLLLINLPILYIFLLLPMTRTFTMYRSRFLSTNANFLSLSVPDWSNASSDISFFKFVQVIIIIRHFKYSNKISYSMWHRSSISDCFSRYFKEQHVLIIH